jgi:hypothetical protein
MGMDRNTTIGFVLIGLLLITMFYFNSKNRLAFEGEQKRIADSIAKINPPKKPESVNVKVDTTTGMSIQSNAAVFGITETQPTLSVVENNLLKATFSSKGGQLTVNVSPQFSDHQLVYLEEAATGGRRRKTRRSRKSRRQNKRRASRRRRH